MNTVVKSQTLLEILDAVPFIHIQEAQTKRRIKIKMIAEQVLHHTQENVSSSMKAEW